MDIDEAAVWTKSIIIYIYTLLYTTEQILSCLLYHKSRDKQGKTMRGYLMAAEVGTTTWYCCTVKRLEMNAKPSQR